MEPINLLFGDAVNIPWCTRSNRSMFDRLRANRIDFEWGKRLSLHRTHFDIERAEEDVGSEKFDRFIDDIFSVRRWNEGQRRANRSSKPCLTGFRWRRTTVTRTNREYSHISYIESAILEGRMISLGETSIGHVADRRGTRTIVSSWCRLWTNENLQEREEGGEEKQAFINKKQTKMKKNK